MTDSFYVNIFLVLLFKPSSFSSKECDESCKNSLHQKSVYNKEDNELLNTIEKTLKEYIPCMHTNCSCYIDTISKDLSTFKSGITESMLNNAKSKGTTYKVIGGRVYRDVDCMFPSRCAGVEHYLRKLRAKLPDLQLVLNTRDWPQISRFQTPTLPVFSFSKTKDYLDIIYPAWAFWEGGPAIKLYPRGLGHWNQHRQSLDRARERWPWREKQAVAFFRGSRTNSERDTLVMLSREKPELIDASYTKNQAWKSDKDTLYAAPADEVSLEDHCRYKYLFNFRGVAASFRFKHLFLCNSLVFHVGDEWLEFFYPALQPWVHYVPVKSNASKNDLRKLLEFVKEHDDLAQHIAQRGRDFIWDHLRSKDVICYWKLLLKNYAKLLKFKPHLEGNEIEIV